MKLNKIEQHEYLKLYTSIYFFKKSRLIWKICFLQRHNDSNVTEEQQHFSVNHNSLQLPSIVTNHMHKITNKSFCADMLETVTFNSKFSHRTWSPFSGSDTPISYTCKQLSNYYTRTVTNYSDSPWGRRGAYGRRSSCSGGKKTSKMFDNTNKSVSRKTWLDGVRRTCGWKKTCNFKLLLNFVINKIGKCTTMTPILFLPYQRHCKQPRLYSVLIQSNMRYLPFWRP